MTRATLLVLLVAGSVAVASGILQVRAGPAVAKQWASQPVTETLVDSASTPAPSGAVGTALYSASATWCAPTPDYCQEWGGNARLAAVHSFRFGDTPYWVRLSRGDAFADALVVSFCACHGQDGYIDVSPAVFRQLAPLSRGRVDVEVEVLNWPYEPGGDPPPHPDDERLRIEDGGPGATLPPTDAVK